MMVPRQSDWNGLQIEVGDLNKFASILVSARGHIKSLVCCVFPRTEVSLLSSSYDSYK